MVYEITDVIKPEETIKVLILDKDGNYTVETRVYPTPGRGPYETMLSKYIQSYLARNPVEADLYVPRSAPSVYINKLCNVLEASGIKVVENRVYDPHSWKATLFIGERPAIAAIPPPNKFGREWKVGVKARFLENCVPVKFIVYKKHSRLTQRALENYAASIAAGISVRCGTIPWVLDKSNPGVKALSDHAIVAFDPTSLKRYGSIEKRGVPAVILDVTGKEVTGFIVTVKVSSERSAISELVEEIYPRAASTVGNRRTVIVKHGTEASRVELETFDNVATEVLNADVLVSVSKNLELPRIYAIYENNGRKMYINQVFGKGLKIAYAEGTAYLVVSSKLTKTEEGKEGWRTKVTTIINIQRNTSGIDPDYIARYMLESTMLAYETPTYHSSTPAPIYLAHRMSKTLYELYGHYRRTLQSDAKALHETVDVVNNILERFGAWALALYSER